MLMMRIRHVRMRMAERFMDMPMAVSADRHGVVRVEVMPIVMAMCVFMIHRLMLVRMTV